MKRLNGSQRTVVSLAALVCVMVGLSFAAVPLYDLFCRVTGFGGTTAVADAGSEQVLDREILIRFEASKDRGMPWIFEPVETTMRLRIGETGLAYYTATNPTDRTVAGSASYNVTPYSAGGYFSKIECFCFTEQVLAPGETVEMPVTFFVDPEIMEDDEASRVHTITLSYTFYETELPPASDADAAASAIDETDPAG